MKRIEHNNFTEWLKSFGLQLTAETGGQQFESSDVTKNNLGFYEMGNVMFFDCNIFMKMVNAVQSKVSYQLFK